MDSPFNTAMATGIASLHASAMAAEQAYAMPEYEAPLTINGILSRGPNVERERGGAAAKFKVLLSEFTATRNPAPGDSIVHNGLTYVVTDIEWGQYADAILWLRIKKRP